MPHRILITGKASTISAQIAALIQKVFAGILRRDREYHAERAKQNPTEYRDSTIFDKPLNYRYIETSGPFKGWKQLRFCYSSNPNVAGYFLSWTEARKGKLWQRIGIRGHDTKKDAIENARWKAREMRKPANERKFEPRFPASRRKPRHAKAEGRS